GERRWADARRSAPRSGPNAAGLSPVGGDAQPRPRVHEGRLRRPEPGAHVEPGVRRVVAPGPPLRTARVGDRARAPLHGRLRDRPRRRAAPAPGRLLDEPRGTPARVRGGVDAARLADW